MALTPPRIVRILASVRIPSTHGPDLDYELIHAVIADPDGGGGTHESVLLRMASGEAARNDLAPEILTKDLPAVHAEWSRFLSDVLSRRAEAGDAEARAALDRLQKPAAARPAAAPEHPEFSISASGGRFGLRTKTSEPMAPMGPRKGAAPPPPPAPPPDEPKKPKIPDEIQVIGFNLSAPPSADGLMKALEAQPRHLIVVAPAIVATRAEDFIRDLKSGAIHGAPTTFSPIVIRRTSTKGATAAKKLKAELAAGISRLLGDMNSALWIMPE